MAREANNIFDGTWHIRIRHNIQVHNILLNCTLFKTIRKEWQLLNLDNSFYNKKA